MKRVRTFLLILLGLASAGFLACGGSGSGGGGGNPNAPSISSVYFSPSSSANNTLVTFRVTFNYSDANGDLDNGTFKWIYGNTSYTKTLLGTIAAGSTSGTVSSLALDPITLNTTVGTVSIPVSLIDNAGNSSSTVYVTITQT